jgi:hypothetical protein
MSADKKRTKPQSKGTVPKKKRRHMMQQPDDLRAQAKREFLIALAKHGVAGTAAITAVDGKFTRTWYYLERTKDLVFDEAWDAACEIGTDGMEQEAWRRAVEGTERPVFQGGEEVGKIREFSDTLMIFLLKARRPKTYRERLDVNVAGGLTNNTTHVHVYMPSNGREKRDVLPEAPPVQGTLAPAPEEASEEPGGGE